MLATVALLIGFTGGVIGRKTTHVSESTVNDKVGLSTHSDPHPPASRFAEVAATVANAVVEVVATSGPFFSKGSGVVIDPTGHIVTNNHVIADAVANAKSPAVSAVFANGTSVPARVVGGDAETDIAVLEVDGRAGLTVGQFGDSDKLNVGDLVVAAGSPLGLRSTVTHGVVSAKHRATPVGDTVIDAIQIDAPTNAGNSGGPLIDMTAHVVGINAARFLGKDGLSIVSIGYSIPINEAKNVADVLIRQGEIRHPTLGVNTRSVSNGQVTGAMVANVRTGGPAQLAGMLENDVVVKVGDRRVADTYEYVVAVRHLTIGQPSPIEVVRGGRSVVLTVNPQADS